ncbi:hypothetical protein [Thiobacter aerophilum]|uniref:Thioredoxin-like fold domain-containing protein n=1 Tax=Thiobacter aerophilum TaxID=3121275 RepID=A0ABV0EFR5_9BURK
MTTMNRRHFLLASIVLLPAMPAWAGMLKGSTPLTGQREQGVWLAVQQLAGLRLTKPEEQTQIVFFFDPNCPACAKLWQWFDTMPRRDVASMWIPVAYMKPTSEARAIALLRTADPYAALAQNFLTFDAAAWEGAMPPVKDATLAEQSSLRKNTRYWSRSLFGATPLILYRAKAGGIWQEVGLSDAADLDRLLSQLATARLSAYTK